MDDIVMPRGDEYAIEVISSKPSDQKTMNPKFKLYRFFFFLIFRAQSHCPERIPLNILAHIMGVIFFFYSSMYCIITHVIHMLL